MQSNIFWEYPSSFHKYDYRLMCHVNEKRYYNQILIITEQVIKPVIIRTIYYSIKGTWNFIIDTKILGMTGIKAKLNAVVKQTCLAVRLSPIYIQGWIVVALAWRIRIATIDVSTFDQATESNGMSPSLQPRGVWMFNSHVRIHMSPHAHT